MVNGQRWWSCGLFGGYGERSESFPVFLGDVLEDRLGFRCPLLLAKRFSSLSTQL